MYPEVGLVGYLVHNDDQRWIRLTLFRAIRCGRLDIIRLLPARCIDIDAIRLTTSLGQTALLDHMLTVSGIDVNTMDSDMSTLLDKAIRHMHIGTMALLTKRGAISITTDPELIGLLHMDAGHLHNIEQRSRILYELYDRARINDQFDASLFTIIGSLLKMGADPNVSNTGYTLLHHAISRRQLELAKLLIDHGADINRSECYNDHTPLHIATFYGYMDGVRLLVEHGAIIGVRSRCRDTPLYNAEVAGYYDIADYLRDHLSAYELLADDSYQELLKKRAI